MKSAKSLRKRNWIQLFLIISDDKKNRKNKFNDDAIILAGSGNVELAQNISNIIGVPLGKVTLKRFSDGECNIQVFI